MDALEAGVIDHVGVPVWDADEAVAFYRRLGVDVAFEEVLDGYSLRVVFLAFDGVYLELMEPLGSGSVRSFLERHGPGYQHVAYRVDDLDMVVEALRDDGVTFRTDEPVAGAMDARIIFVEERHTGGLEIELLERPTKS